MTYAGSHSVAGKIVLVLFSLLFIVGVTLFFMYKADTPFTEYVDYQLAYHYEEINDYENTIKYYKKINTEESLSYLDDTYRDYAEHLMSEGNYLKALKMFQSVFKMTRTEREHLEALIQTDEFYQGLYDNLNDPYLAKEDYPDYVPVKITSENFNDYFYFTDEIHADDPDHTGTVFRLYLKEEFRDAFEYANELNTVSITYSYSGCEYNYRNQRLGSFIRKDTPNSTLKILGYPKAGFRNFGQPEEDGCLAKIELGWLSKTESNGIVLTIELAQELVAEEANGLIFIDPEALR